MTNSDAGYVKCTIQNEGFEYCFLHYSDFKNIEDELFHKLRNQYLDSMDELQKYINDNFNGDYDN